MSDSFAEFRSVTTLDPLRQGDVLEAVDEGASRWKRNLLVITADCDFAFDKHQGRVTCVPLLSTDEYMVEMQLPKIREKLLARAVKELREALVRIGLHTISDNRLREWVSEDDTESIATALGVPTGQKVVRDLIDSIRFLSSPFDSVADAIPLFVDGQLRLASPPKRAAAISALRANLREAFAHPPGDALFLSAFSPNHRDGYFAYLRHLEQIWEPDISIGPTRKGMKYRRISRMQDRYTLAVVQRFAMVFMSIGLPAEYEETRDVYAEFLGEDVN